MKKVLLSLAVIVGFGLYALFSRNRSSAADAVVVPPLSSSTAVPSPVVSTTTPTAEGKYKDGTYTGSVADAYYGNVQVKVTVSLGRITDVQFLDYPQDRRTSQQINSQAMPYLKQEAIQVQSASVDIVSGATATSGAFQQSLASALQQAM